MIKIVCDVENCDSEHEIELGYGLAVMPLGWSELVRQERSQKKPTAAVNANVIQAGAIQVGNLPPQNFQLVGKSASIDAEFEGEEYEPPPETKRYVICPKHELPTFRRRES